MRCRSAFVVIVGLLLVGSACGSDPAESDQYRALQAQFEAMELERDLLAQQIVPPIGHPIDLTAFSEAWGSGDPDRVRAFYTEDAIIFPIGVDEVSGDSIAGGWGMTDDLDREVSQHAGGTYEIFAPVRVGDIATFTWRWDLGMIISGANILYFHDDLIWREFIDYQLGE